MPNETSLWHIEHLNKCSVSEYIAKNPFVVLTDALFLRNSKSIDKKSKGRGLVFTLDGIHLNNQGATIVAEAVLKEINDFTCARK